MRFLVWFYVSLFSIAAYAADLNEVLVHTYNHNDALKAARETTKIQSEQIAQAIDEFLPQISASNSIGQQRQSTDITNSRSGATTQQIKGFTRSQSLNINQPLFNAGASIAGLKAARHIFDISVQDLKLKEQKILLETINAYMAVLATKELLEINNNNVEVSKKTLESTTARFTLGELTRTDVALAKSKLSEAISNKISAEGEYINARASYTALVGLEPDNLVYPKLPETLASNLDDATRLALSGNPELLKARATVELSSKKLWQAAAKLLPNIYLSASVSRARSPNASFGPDTNSISTTRAATINMNVPIFNAQGGGSSSQVRVQKRTLQQDKSNLLNISGAVVSAITQDWQNLQKSKSTLESNEEQAAYSEIAYQGYVQEAEVGSRTVLDVITSEQNWFNAKLAVTKAKKELLVAAYAVKARLGELTAEKLALETEIYDPKKYYDKAKLQLIGF